VERRRIGVPRLAEHPGQVEVRIRVVGLHLERAPVPPYRRREVAQVLVERAQVERGLAAGVVGLERGAVAGLGALVAPHPVLEQAQVVPRGGIAGVDVHHALVGLDGRLPALGVAVPRRRAREPDLGGVRGRDERADHAHQERLAGLTLEIAALEVQQRLAGARVEAQPVLFDHDLLVLYHQPQLCQRGLGVRGEAPRAVERLAHLAHRRAALEEGRSRAGRHELAEAVAGRIAPQQAEALELPGALRRQPQEPGQLPQGENPLRPRHGLP
jgi:hypothetical protein